MYIVLIEDYVEMFHRDVTPYIWSCRCWRGARVSLQVALIGWGAAQRKSTSTSSSLTAFIATHPLHCFFRVNSSSCCCLAFSGSLTLPWRSKQAQYADCQTNHCFLYIYTKLWLPASFIVFCYIPCVKFTYTLPQLSSQLSKTASYIFQSVKHRRINSVISLPLITHPVTGQ